MLGSVQPSAALASHAWQTQTGCWRRVVQAHVVQVDRGAAGPSEGHGVSHAGQCAGGTRTQPAGVRAHASVPSGWRGGWAGIASILSNTCSVTDVTISPARLVTVSGAMPVYPIRMMVCMASSASAQAGGQQPGLSVVRADASVADGGPRYRYLTIAQACAMTGYSRTTIERAVRDEQLGRYGLPRAPRLLEHELVAWMTNPPAPKRRPAGTAERAGLPGSQLRW